MCCYEVNTTDVQPPQSHPWPNWPREPARPNREHLTPKMRTVGEDGEVKMVPFCVNYNSKFSERTQQCKFKHKCKEAEGKEPKAAPKEASISLEKLDPRRAGPPLARTTEWNSATQEMETTHWLSHPTGEPQQV